MRYALIDFKNLATAWYNEFLPRIAEQKMGFVEEAGVIYMDCSTIVSDGLKEESCKFILEKTMRMQADMSSESNGRTILLVVREPKPIGRPTLNRFLGWVSESDLDEDRRNRIMHIANRRYSISSADVIVSQDRELDLALDWTFDVLSRHCTGNAASSYIRFFPSESLGFDEMAGVAVELFPRSSISILKDENTGENHIQVNSSAELLLNLAKSLSLDGIQPDSSVSRFIDQSMINARKTLEQLI